MLHNDTLTVVWHCQLVFLFTFFIFYCEVVLSSTSNNAYECFFVLYMIQPFGIKLAKVM